MDLISSYIHSIEIIIGVLAVFIVVGVGLMKYGSSFLPPLIWLALAIVFIAFILPIL